MQVLTRAAMLLFRTIAVVTTTFVCATACDSLSGGASLLSADTEAMGSANEEYQLGSEDKLKVTVYGESDLSGEFVVDSAGVASMPFIGQIQAKGLTKNQFGRAYADKLREAKIMKDPKINVEVLTFRPIYILGEVNKPGRYPYVSGMTVEKAVALAEGYTYRADQKTADITRLGRKFAVDVTPQTTVAPGDAIHIRERFF